MSAQAFVYNNAYEGFATKQINWATATVHCALVDGNYAPSRADEYLSDIPNASILADAALSATSVTANGICYGTIPIYLSFLNAAPVAAMVLYLYTGTPSSSLLIYYSSAGAGFPFLAQGFNYAIGYDQLSGGWFQV